MMTRIAIVVVYFGKFRSDMDFWIKSVSFNPTINFLLFTDTPIQNPPSNLSVINKTYKEVVEKIQSNFDFKVNIPCAYKIPDFRPAFGDIFADYLKGYDFWGFCDTDLVFGNIRAFMTEDLLSRYDKLLAMGHFTLYRNTPEVNIRYQHCEEPTYKQVFTFPCNSAFEEYWGTSRYWDIYYGEKFYQGIPFDDIDCYRYHFCSQFKKRQDVGKMNFIYSFENGKLYRIYELSGAIHKEETMYVHFQKRKMYVSVKAGDFFMMIPNAYIEFNDNLSLEELRKLTSSKVFYIHKYKLQWNRIKNKFAKFKASLKSSEFGIPKLPNDGVNYYFD